ncbi:MAG: hypothetical protein Q4D40_05310 [Eubacteriales bacterium]|nr:hypothetical protein [Eubacteriales bacterium]
MQKLMMNKARTAGAEKILKDRIRRLTAEKILKDKIMPEYGREENNWRDYDRRKVF